MSLTLEVFEKLKSNVNTELEQEFKIKFMYILRKFESLSKSSNYKKISKANIIQIPDKNNDSILTLLNKISDSNYDVISQKILLKITKSNITSFVDQILEYVEKSNTTSLALWNLIKLIASRRMVSTEQKMIIRNKVKSFIDKFKSSFDVSNTVVPDMDKELYIDFVERNHLNTSIISKIKLIHVMINDNDIYDLNYDTLIVFSIFMNQLCNLIHENKDENLTYMLLECILIILNDPKLIRNPYAYKKFLNMFDNDETKKKLKNKIRFKLMDIIDIIKKNGV